MTISGRLFESLSCATADEDQRSPLGLSRSGRPMWPIYGAMPDDDDADDDEEDDEPDADADDDDDTADKDKPKSKSKKDDEDDGDDDLKERLEDAEARADRYKKRMQAADRKNSELTRRVEALEKGKGGDDAGGEPADNKALEEERDSLKSANAQLRVENSFLLNNKFTWHDPADVLALVLKDEDVEVDEDGNVQGMEAALKRIARKKPWLVKPEKAAKSARDAEDADDDDDDDEDDDDERETRSSRRNPSGGGRAGQRGTRVLDKKALAQTYPALSRR